MKSVKIDNSAAFVWKGSIFERWKLDDLKSYISESLLSVNNNLPLFKVGGDNG